MEQRVRSRRWLREGAAAAGMGMLATIGFAWWAPVYDGFAGASGFSRDETKYSIVRAANGEEYLAWITCSWLRTDWVVIPHSLMGMYGPRNNWGHTELPSWITPPQIGPDEGISALAFGTPMRSLAFEQHSHTEFFGGQQTTRVEELSGWYIAWRQGIVLPTRVLWWGFIADNALLGAACWLVVFGPRHVRAWWRRRTARCVACGYSVKDARGRCPECGAGALISIDVAGVEK